MQQSNLEAKPIQITKHSVAVLIQNGLFLLSRATKNGGFDDSSNEFTISTINSSKLKKATQVEVYLSHISDFEQFETKLD